MMFGKWNLGHWLVISMAIHALAVSPFALAGLHPPKKPSDTKFQMELFGMITDRQVAEKRLGEDVPRPAVKPPEPKPLEKVPEKKLRAKKETLPEKERTPIDSPVKVEEKAEEEASAETARSALPAGSDADQRQQTVQHAAKPMDERYLYAVAVSDKVKARVAYPKELNNSGIEGVPTVAFIVTLGGTIKEGSLKVARSSGFAAMDAKALQAVRDSAPFDKPPKEDLFLTIDVKFGDEGKTATSKGSQSG